MCYTGKCTFENSMGDCELDHKEGDPWPCNYDMKEIKWYKFDETSNSVGLPYLIALLLALTVFFAYIAW